MNIKSLIHEEKIMIEIAAWTVIFAIAGVFVLLVL
jgi:hypothetical protein